MAAYLLHSMSHFSEIFRTLLDECAPNTIVEVGSEYAGSTRVLAGYAKDNNIQLIVVDPTPKVSLNAVLPEFHDAYRFVPQKSVDALPNLSADIFFLDGDHNYWTVRSELQAIYAENPDAWTILHDVGNPCSRRDQYYAPNEIPADHRHQYSYDYGIDLKTNKLQYRSGFWGAGEFAIAVESGTPRNGVLTAVEDFISQRNKLYYSSIPLIFGLGIIVPQHKAEYIDRIFAPFQGCLCDELERNRLELYAEVLELTYQLRGTRFRRWVNRCIDMFPKHP